MDKEYDQFCEQVDKIKKQMNSIQSRRKGEEEEGQWEHEQNVFKNKGAKKEGTQETCQLKRDLKRMERLLEQTKAAHIEEI